VATALATVDVGPDVLIDRADRVLYAAKRTGRDCMVAAPD
jgi:PleD family two-component response regulator